MSEYATCTTPLLNQNSLKRTNCGFMSKGQRRSSNTSYMVQPQLVVMLCGINSGTNYNQLQGYCQFNLILLFVID